MFVSVHRYTVCTQTHMKFMCIFKVCPAFDFQQTSVHISKPTGHFVTLSANLKDKSIDDPYPSSPFQEMLYILKSCSNIFLNNKTPPDLIYNKTPETSKHHLKILTPNTRFPQMGKRGVLGGILR